MEGRRWRAMIEEDIEHGENDGDRMIEEDGGGGQKMMKGQEDDREKWRRTGGRIEGTTRKRVMEGGGSCI